MRPAPPGEPPSNSDLLQSDLTSFSGGPSRNVRQRRSTQWWIVRIGAGVVLLALIAVGTFVLLGGSTPLGPAPTPPPTSPPSPPREAFVFPLYKTTSTSTGRRNGAGVRTAATRIQATLSAFYDAAFMDPRNREAGLPPEAWSVFAKQVRDRAVSDAAALTLGESGPDIAELSVTESSLTVRVLLDPRGRPHAAVATVLFDASGNLRTGEVALVSNRASFLLEPDGTTWLIVGYPSAATEVDTPAPSPSPGASASVTPGGTPTPGTSP